LTLLAVPVFYSLFEEAKQSRLARAIGRKLGFLGEVLQHAGAGVRGVVHRKGGEA